MAPFKIRFLILKSERRIELNTKGFAPIEVLISLGILAVGLLPIAGMQIASVQGSLFSDHLTQASYLGQDGLEYFKSS